VTVVQDFGGIRDGECCASIFGLGIELGDNYRLLENCLESIGKYIRPIISTMPVNMIYLAVVVHQKLADDSISLHPAGDWGWDNIVSSAGPHQAR
jgi:hypothetical protein